MKRGTAGSEPDADRVVRLENGLRGVFQDRPSSRRAFLETPSTMRPLAVAAGTSETGSPPGAAAEIAGLPEAQGPSPSHPARRAEAPVVSERANRDADRPASSPAGSLYSSPVAAVPEPARPRSLRGGETPRRAGQERRVSHRHVVRSVRVRLQWSDEGGSISLTPGNPLVEHPAEIVDISQSGICVLCGHVPPGNREIWISAPGAEVEHWSRVVLRSLSEPELGRFCLRLAFAETCPYELFKLAVLEPFRLTAIAMKEAGPGAS
ncbi:hypothetical protein [Aquisphaera insulae]|uniref:hypothetical protein n=1 Tax=Aquisphaera insulae TaxID=2712864 RepID=UPI0013EDA8F9|nr:hypothetical protein [Aquisphaera insulae]